MNATENMKQKVRASKAWKDLRNRLKKERKVDALTLKPLRQGWILHHCDLNADHYADLGDETHFECLGKQSHDVIHALARYYHKDKSIVRRLGDILEKMDRLTYGK